MLKVCSDNFWKRDGAKKCQSKSKLYAIKANTAVHFVVCKVMWQMIIWRQLMMQWMILLTTEWLESRVINRMTKKVYSCLPYTFFKNGIPLHHQANWNSILYLANDKFYALCFLLYLCLYLFSFLSLTFRHLSHHQKVTAQIFYYIQILFKLVYYTFIILKYFSTFYCNIPRQQPGNRPPSPFFIVQINF